MANLWRAMALAWLGGLASPVLLDDPAMIDTSPLAAVTSPMLPAYAAPEPYDFGGDEGTSVSAGVPDSGPNNQ